MRSRRTIQMGAPSGAIAALVMILGQAIARLGAGVPMFPDLLEDSFTRAIPSALFSQVLDVLKFQAKPLLFVGILVLQIVVGAVLGAIFAEIWGRDAQRVRRHWAGWRGAVGGSIFLWLVTGVLVLPAAGQGAFGSATLVGPVGLNIALVASFLLYGETLAASYRVLVVSGAHQEPATSPERRRLLGGLAVGVVAALAVGATDRIISAPKLGVALAIPPEPQPSNAVASTATSPAASAVPTPTVVASTVTVTAPTATTSSVAESASSLAKPSTTMAWNIPGLTPEVSTPKEFYIVSKNFFSDPVVDPTTWSLQITGLVKKPYSITYDQLLKLPFEERYETLECISNEVGGNLISNASWRGVSLHKLLTRAEPDAKAIKAVFTAADGYTDDLPVAKALSTANLLAYLMDGKPLLSGHGGPARLLIPGIFGMKNVKWIRKIELVDSDYLGYWEQRGWSDKAVIPTMSRIDLPTTKQGVIKAGKTEIAGIAFAGDRGISKVEISFDGGRTWQTATLKDALGPFTWRLWRLDWNPKPGNYKIFVRAIDGDGKVQTPVHTSTLPDGATGWDSEVISISP